MPSHVHRRGGGVYYTRMVVPPRLRSIIGKSDLGRSLLTSDYKEMTRLQPLWLEEAQAIIDAADRELSRQQAIRTADAAPYDPYALMSEEQFERQQQQEAEEARQIAAEDDAWMEAQEWEASLDPTHPGARLLAGAKAERDRYRDRYHARRQRDLERASPPREKQEPTFWARSNEPDVTITGMFAGYASQDGVKKTTASQFRAIIMHLVAFLGHDDAKRVELADLVRWREHLRTTPIKNGEPRSPKTINGSYLAAASVTFSYGLNQLLIANNPARELQKVRATKAIKLREKDFDKVERKAILSAALIDAPDRMSEHRAFARRWVPWICAYTGARVNEITQLRGVDVQQVDGVWTFRITPDAGSTKTGQYRSVPIHEHLIAQGFLAAIQRKGSGPLFYVPPKADTDVAEDENGGRHKRIGMWLAHWVRNDVGVKDPDILPNHAWRHTFKTICREVQIDEWASDAITGHASKAQGHKYGSSTIPALAAQLEKFPRFDLE